MDNLVHCLEKLKHVSDRGITAIKGHEEEHFISYAELYAKAVNVSLLLRESGLEAYDELILQIDDIHTFLIYFWACLFVRIIPVPVTLLNSEETELKLTNILRILNNPKIVISKKNYEKMCKDYHGVIEKNTHKILLCEDLEALSVKQTSSNLTYPEPDNIAFLQFSSGSTGDPKGVMLTHCNLLTNVNGIITSAKITSDDSFLSWMPLTHDMGLIGFHIVPLIAGIPQYIMPTTLFIRNPVLWLQKTSQHRATLLSAPNFGCKFLLRFFNPERITELDLTSVRLIFNGAEPIAANICEEFLEVLGKFGLKRCSMFPVYGLAEACLAVAFPPVAEEYSVISVNRRSLNFGEPVQEISQDKPDACVFVVEGYPVRNCFVRITDHGNNLLPEKTVGNIEIRGSNVTRGYYRDPQRSAECISKDGWLRTGDLGFFVDGKLVVTGRTKDILFMNGQNYYAHDIERLSEAVEGIKPGKVAIGWTFNQQAGEDDILLFTVYKKKNWEHFTKLCHEIKKYIMKQAGLQIGKVIPVNAIPKTTSGKPQRYLLVEQYRQGAFDAILAEIAAQEHKDTLKDLRGNISVKDGHEHVLTMEEIKAIIVARVDNILGYTIREYDANFTALGIDSMKVPHIQKLWEEAFQITMPISVVFDYPTVNKLSAHIQTVLCRSSKTPVAMSGTNYTEAPALCDSEPIAIIGMACRFPGDAGTPERYWHNLKQGLDTIDEIPDNRWKRMVNAYKEESRYPCYGGFLSEIDYFDAAFFNITPLEAKEIDPQQRLLLEVSWEAMEYAGLDIAALEDSRTGVFIGMSNNEYLYQTAKSEHSMGSYALTGSLFSTASGRISYTYGFQGPSLTIDTACSSSLVAVHQAAASLRHHECDVALAGGINLILSSRGYIGFSKLQALSNDGRCKTFDDRTDGYGRSEGCGIVVLKRLSQARRDNDRVSAIITGSAVNHNGKSSGLTVPNGVAQERVIRDALAKANLSPGDVDYIEAHGSATKLGDPLEVNALANVFSKNGARTHSLWIGSVKTNIGHAESAAGIAGLIKVILALQHNLIPRHLHFKTPNRFIPWNTLPIRVVDTPVAWERNGKPRIAGISSFGISGTNAHLIIQDAPEAPERLPEAVKPVHLFTLSAHKDTSLHALLHTYQNHLKQTDDRIEDICYTLNCSRTGLKKRFAIPVQTTAEALKRLDGCLNHPERITSYSTPQVNINPKVVFQFTGQGSYYPGIGRELYENASIFRQAVDRCDALFRNYLRESLVDVLYSKTASRDVIDQPLFAQAIIFAIEYALSQLWISFGIIPDLIIGHSIGEYAGACTAGIFSLEDAVTLVGTRGMLMQEIPDDGMMAGVLSNVHTIEPFLQQYRDTVSIAAINSAENITISGKKASVERLLRELQQQRIFIERLRISHAFHSVLMSPYVEALYQKIRDIPFVAPRIPVISSSRTNHAVHCAEYWSTHIRNPVYFSDSLNTARTRGYQVFLEIGGTATLSGIGQESFDNNTMFFLPSLRQYKGAWEQVMESLGKFYVLGVPIHWAAVNEPYAYQKVRLPFYQFEKKSYWIDEQTTPPVKQPVFEENDQDVQSDGPEHASSQLIYSLKWEEKKVLSAGQYEQPEQKQHERLFLLLSDQKGFCDTLCGVIEKTSHTYLRISRGGEYSVIAPSHYTIDPGNTEHIKSVLNAIDWSRYTECSAIYMEGLDTTDTGCLDVQRLYQDQQMMYTCLLNWLTVLYEKRTPIPFKLWIITKNVHSPASSSDQDHNKISVSQSTLWGFFRGIESEMPEHWGGIIDIDDTFLTQNAPLILNEILTETDSEICLRNTRERYVPRLMEVASHSGSRLFTAKDDKTYIITGGLGDLGLLTAQWLTASGGAKNIVLMSRRNPHAETKKIIERLQTKSVRIEVYQGDVANPEDVTALKQFIDDSMPPVAGIIHAAGVQHHESIFNHSWSKFKRGLRPKVMGTWNLYKIFENAGLEFFALFSSAAIVMGLSGHIDYVAANAFLNTFAFYGQAKNINTICLNWGFWDKIGMGVAAGAEKLEVLGVHRLAPDIGLLLLEEFLAAGPSRSKEMVSPYAASIDWAMYSHYISEKQKHGVFAKCIVSDNTEQKESELITSLMNCMPDEKRNYLLKYLKESSGKVMGYLEDIDSIQTDTPLREQGMDSLMSVKFHKTLEIDLNIKLSTSLLFTYPTLTRIADHLLNDKLFMDEKQKGIVKRDSTKDILDEIQHYLEEQNYEGS